MKRTADIIISFILIMIFLPVMLVTGLIIKLSSPGPIFFYSQRNKFNSYRIGKYGKPFFYFKFRSMFINSEVVTGFGLFIRRWHLDELPELFLVFKGTMSLVGPRPVQRNYVIRNRKLYYDSLRAKPGITGPWQINRQTDKTIEDIIEMNQWYYKNQSFLTDLTIILKTPLSIVKHNCGVTKTLTIL